MIRQVVRLILWVMVLFCSLSVHAEHVTVLTTRADGTKLLEMTTVQTGTSYGTNIIRLMPEEEFQTMDGFGYALTYSSCYNLMKMAGHERRELLRRTFSPTEGFGVSYTRISIGCSDFSSKVYTLCDQKGLAHFALTKKGDAIDKTEMSQQLPAVVNVYDMQGRLVKTNVKAGESLNGLPRGLYIVGGKKMLK